MKKQLLICTLLLNSASLCFSQDTLMYENFEAGNAAFTLNTTGVSGTSSGYNHWVVNNAYVGGSGQITCIGLPFTFTVPDTPDQPAQITGSPSSSYLHTLSAAAEGVGVNNCCFLAADGVCNAVEYYFTEMTSDISTVNYNAVSFSFWWICDGGNNSYGEIYYSIDGGANWIVSTALPKYNNNTSWSYQSITDAAFDGQPSLRFGIRFVNKVALNTSDPGFGLDEISIAGTVNNLGIDNHENGNSAISVSPNPSADGIFALSVKDMSEKNASVKITDVTGRLISNQKMELLQSNNKFLVDISGNKAGIYYLSVQTPHGIINKKLLLTE